MTDETKKSIDDARRKETALIHDTIALLKADGHSDKLATFRILETYRQQLTEEITAADVKLSEKGESALLRLELSTHILGSMLTGLPAERVKAFHDERHAEQKRTH